MYAGLLQWRLGGTLRWHVRNGVEPVERATTCRYGPVSHPRLTTLATMFTTSSLYATCHQATNALPFDTVGLACCHCCYRYGVHNNYARWKHQRADDLLLSTTNQIRVGLCMRANLRLLLVYRFLNITRRTLYGKPFSIWFTYAYLKSQMYTSE